MDRPPAEPTDPGSAPFPAPPAAPKPPARSALSRREALGRLAWTGTGMGAAWSAGMARARAATPTPSPASGSPPAKSQGIGTSIGAVEPLPDVALRRSDPERYWTRVRRGQFLLPETRAFLNPGSLGVMPRPVMQAVFDSLQRGAEYATDTVQRWGYESMEPERAEMAAFLGCDPGELAFTHNCTEAMGFIAAGLDLKPGDEVVSTNQEHGSGISCWRVKAARSGITLREVDLPVSPRSSAELLDRLVSALGPRTRVLSFSGITSPTGLVLPSRELCEAARARGVITVLDGAHMDGQMPVNLHDLGCDYFAGSPHKWLFAPAGCGLLYGRPEALDRLWPSVASGGWDNKTGLKAARFMMVGTNNRSTIDGMIAGLRFLQALGEEAVYERQHALAAHALSAARQRNYLEVVTPEDPRLHRAMISLRFKSDALEPLWTALRQEDIGVLGGQRLRLSFHVHTRKSDIDRFFGVCDRVLRS